MKTTEETEEKTEREDGADDDDDDDDKAKVNVMKPVGEPEESAAQPEATGLSMKRKVITDYNQNVCSVPNLIYLTFCLFQCVPACFVPRLRIQLQRQ